MVMGTESGTNFHVDVEWSDGKKTTYDYHSAELAREHCLGFTQQLSVVKITFRHHDTLLLDWDRNRITEQEDPERWDGLS